MGCIFVRNVVLMISVVALIMAVADSDSPKLDVQLPASKWTVHVVNKMESGGALFLHCKSKDNDLGIHNVTYDREFTWTFKENLRQSTLFWCYFKSSHGHAEFNVYWPERSTWLEFRCDYSDCIWNAKDDGVYLRNIPLDFDDYKHDWNSTTL